MANYQTVGTLTFVDAVNSNNIKMILTVTPSFQLSLQTLVNNVDKGTISTNGIDGNALGRAILDMSSIVKSQGG